MNRVPGRLQSRFFVAPLLLLSFSAGSAVGDELASPWLLYDGLMVKTTPSHKGKKYGVDKARLQVVNKADEAFVGPLRVVITESSREVLNPDGYTEDGKPYFLVSSDKEYELAPGTWTDKIRVQFGKTVVQSEGSRSVFSKGFGRFKKRGHGKKSEFRFEAVAQYSPSFMMQLLHTADMDGATGALTNVKNFSGLLNYFREGAEESTVTLSSGDNFIPGPRYTAAEDGSLGDILGVPGAGRGDIVMLNAMGFEASAVGNHDLDGGTAGLASVITAGTDDDDTDPYYTGTYEGAFFPYLSSNLDFTTDDNLAGLVVADGQPATTIPGSLAGTTTIEVNGEVIGIVGASTPKLASITSTGDITVLPEDSDDLAGLSLEIQAAVDSLTATGINKVILLAHMQQISVEIQLASLLHDVDIIVAGGSNTLLADENDVLREGDTAASQCTDSLSEASCTYPIILESASGEPVLVVNTDGDYTYLGRLILGFDGKGVVVEESLDSLINGAWATDDETLELAGNPGPDATVVAVADALGAVLAERDGNILGVTDVYLDGRRSQVRTQETNLGDLTADANLWMAQLVDPSTVISLKNGGGIRDDIGYYEYPPGSVSHDNLVYYPPAANEAVGKLAGDISQFDLQGALRFNNGLTLLTVTAEQLAEIIEHSVAATATGETPGQFPQVAGVRFSFDPEAPAYDRVQTLVVETGDGDDVVIQGGELQGETSRTFRMVTLNYLAGGGDNYPFPTDDASNIVDLVESGLVDEDAGENASEEGLDANFAEPGSEQDALAEYLQEFFNPTETPVPYTQEETPAEEDERIQNLSLRSDTVIQ